MMLPPNTSHFPESAPQVLIGVLIDVSHSMQENWRNKDGKQIPRIEAVRDAINEKINHWQRRNQVEKGLIDNIDIFCLGFGFRYPRYIEYDIQTSETDQPLQKKEKIEIIDLICDILALSEILPTREELTDFRERLNQKWYQCAGYIFDQAKIIEDVYTDLCEYIQETMYSSSMQLLHPNILTVFSRRSGWVSRWLAERLRKKEEKIRNTSYRAARAYADEVAKQAEDDLNKNKGQYVALIEHALEQFIASYVADVLQALTLGFTSLEIVNDLNEQLALSLARQIYAELDQKVRQHITFVIALQQQKLKLAKWSILAYRLNLKKVTHLTQRFVQKYAWDFLSPLIDNTVYTMFTQQFETQAKQSFSHWLRLAAAREVTRPLAKISTLLPTVFEESVYSEEVMFGASPFRQALDQAAARFIDEAYENHRKILLIISDGEFREDTQVMVSANLLKRRGVTLISGLIHKKNLLAQFKKEAPTKWPSGARRMLELASEITEQDHSFSQNKQLVKALINKKLCYQLNHSIMLEELLDTLFNVKPQLNDDAPRRSSVG